MTASSGTHLTTSRINRLFRPLRAKCTTLSEYSSSRKRSAVSVTYSHKSRPPSRTPSLENDAPPLAILQTPESLGSRIHLDRASVENLQLSRKIYEVRDAFKNVVQMALGQDSTVCAPEIRSLATMCAMVVGENVETEAQAVEEIDDDTSDLNNNAAAQIMEELYESVPPHYRSHSVISHALFLVLDICPKFPTLLTALLDVCLSYQLITESRHVLRQLFTSAIESPTSSSPTCPLAHPAHSNYLTGLFLNCTIDKRPNSNRYRFDGHTFTTTLVDALTSSAKGRVDAWTSKAVSRFARELQRHDLRAFMHLCHGLAYSITDLEHLKRRARAKGKSKATAAEPICETRLRSRLARWLKPILDRFHTHTVADVNSDPEAPLLAIDNNDCQSIVNFLLSATSLQLHIAPVLPAETSTYLPDTLICLTTYALCIPTPPSALLPDLATLSRSLLATRPTSASYDFLVSPLFVLPPVASLLDDHLTTMSYTPTPTPPPMRYSPQLQPDVMQTLRRYARTLRSQRLYRLEASLWSNALRHVEDQLLTHSSALFTAQSSFVSSMASTEDIDALRQQLVQRIERAEARCFGASTSANQTALVHAPPDPPVSHGRDQVSVDEHEWVWEDMVGCWVQRSPRVQNPQRALKRRKLNHGTAFNADTPRLMRSQLRSRKSESAVRISQAESNSSRVRTTARQSMPQTDGRAALKRNFQECLPSDEFESFPGTQRSAVESLVEDGRSNDEIHPPSPASVRSADEVRARRLSRVGSLADALANCIVLHPKPKMISSCANTSSGPPIKSKRVRDWSPERGLSLRDCNSDGNGVCDVTQLSSDDALDLFAYHG